MPSSIVCDLTCTMTFHVPKYNAVVVAADQDLVEVAARLLAATGEAQGRLRVTDAMVLAGFDRSSHYRARLVAQAMRHLGWERMRYRFEGALTYMYARGSRLSREMILEVDHANDGRPVLKQKEA